MNNFKLYQIYIGYMHSIYIHNCVLVCVKFINFVRFRNQPNKKKKQANSDYYNIAKYL